MKLQFRLRALMIVVTLLAVPLGYVGWQAKIVRERKAMLKLIESEGGSALHFTHWEIEPPVPWLQRVLGDNYVDTIVVFRQPDAKRIAEIKDVFPEADIWFFENDSPATLNHATPP